MRYRHRVLLVLIAASAVIGCSRLPSQVHEVIFEKSAFSTPFGIVPGPDDGMSRVQWAKTNSVNNSFIPTLILSKYDQLDKRLLSFLVERGYSKVECVAMIHATQPNACYVIHNPNVTDLGHIARRRLDSITYFNKYDSNILGANVKVAALTFKYRVEVTDKQFPAISQVFDGAGKAILNPDTGKWQLLDLSLTDKGPLILYEYVHSQYKPYEPAVQDEGKIPTASPPETTSGTGAQVQQSNPGYTMAKKTAAMDPNLEIISTNDVAGIITVRYKSTGKVISMKFDPIANEMIVIGEDGKHARITSGNGGVTLQSADGTMKFGGSVALPKWVPVYPGSSPTGTMSSTTAVGSQNTFTFKSKDSAAKIIAFYSNALKAVGFTINMTTNTDHGGMVQASDEGEKHTLSVIVGTSGDGTETAVTAVEKK